MSVPQGHENTTGDKVYYGKLSVLQKKKYSTELSLLQKIECTTGEGVYRRELSLLQGV